MHMFNAMVSPAVCAATNLTAAALVGYAIVKLRRSNLPLRKMAPMMAVSAAFIFAAQMLNFSLPGTEVSGHLIGGILLASLLGPWASTLTMAAVITLQCLLMGDGGIMALGCNIINMAVIPCMVVYPILMRPLLRRKNMTGIVMGSIFASVAALLLGAASLSVMTALSGTMPLGEFMPYMLQVHLLIGLAEGLITALALGLVFRLRPEMLGEMNEEFAPIKRSTLAVIAAMALLIAVSASLVASQYPDGMEWSIEQVLGMRP